MRIMLALCSTLETADYAQIYARLIGAALLCTLKIYASHAFPLCVYARICTTVCTNTKRMIVFISALLVASFQGLLVP